MASPSIISAGTLPMPLKIAVPNIDRVIQYFDRIKVYRSATSTGVFTEVTPVATRIPLSAGQTNYEFVDPTGSSTDYYKVSYFNTTSGAESSLSEAQLAEGDPALDLITVDDFKTNFLFGLPLTDSEGVELPDSFFEFYIKSAVSWLERRLDIPLKRTVYLDERHDFMRQDYNKYIWLQLNHKPLISVESINMVLPSNYNVITYNLEWVLPDRDSGVIQIVPGSGSTAVALDFTSLWAPLLNGLLDFVPEVFRVNYTAGFAPGRVPADIIELVGMTAALSPLAILGDVLFGPGIAGNTISLDALMTAVKTTKDGGNSAFAGRIRQYRSEIEARIREIRRNYQGVRFVVA